MKDSVATPETSALPMACANPVYNIQATSNKAPCNNCMGVKTLTQRETDVLVWAAAGKTTWETAKILGIKETTAICYMRCACEKLLANNKTHAVAIAVCSRLVELNPSTRQI
ncbi:helix-turn-helix transcriptional regulator [Bradyrhizobium sp. Arg314]